MDVTPDQPAKRRDRQNRAQGQPQGDKYFKIGQLFAIP